MHKACRQSFHARDSAIQNQRSRRTGEPVEAAFAFACKRQSAVEGRDFPAQLHGDPFRTGKSNETAPAEGQACRPIVPANALNSPRSSADLILTNHTQWRTGASSETA